MQRDVPSSAAGDEDDLAFNDETGHSPRRHCVNIEHRDPRFDFNFIFSRRFKFNKFYLFALLVPLTVVLVYFSVDIRNFFDTNIPAIRYDVVTHRMWESQLRALHLLQQQQLGLLSIWDRNFGNFSIANSNSTNLTSFDWDSSSGFGNAVIQDVKSAILEQLSLNREIQQLLLSPHGNTNPSELENDYSFNGLGNNRCQKVDQKFSQRRTIEWKPRSNKFLLAICTSGQMSNHLICLEKHMFFAALLDRILVIPSSKVDYQYSRVLDIEHVNKCLGKNVVVTFHEFARMKKNHVHIDKFLCYFSAPSHCYIDEDHIKKLKHLGASLAKLEAPWVEDIGRPSKKTVQDILAKFSSDANVIAIGDVFYADVEQDWVTQPGGPLAHKCKTLIQPSQYILLTAQRFIQTFLGRDYIALHFRRHGFLKFCNAKRPSCFYPIPQAAACISRVVERAKAKVIYLSTDAAESETDLLQSLVTVNGKVVPLVKRPPRNSAEKWDALLYRHNLEGDRQVEAMLDKTICAMSSVFIGASGSTFTEDILRLRKGWGSASLCDEYLCQGEEPNYIADDEQ